MATSATQMDLRNGQARSIGSHPAARAAMGLVMASAAAAAMGGAAPALKVMGSHGLPPLNVVQGRAITGAVALMIIALVLRRGRIGVGRETWWLLAAYGVVSLAANQVVFTMSLIRLPVGVALLLEYLAPVLVALWVRFVRRRSMSGLAWVGIAGALAGLALVGQVGSGVGIDGVGIALGLLAAATMAARFLLADRGLRTQDPLTLAAWGATVSAVSLLPTGFIAPFPLPALVRDVELGGIPMPLFVLVLWVGLVGTAGGVLLSVAAQRLLAPTSVSLVLTLEVLVGAGLAFVILGEELTAIQLLGGGVMLAGVAVAQAAMVLHRSGTERNQ